MEDDLWRQIRHRLLAETSAFLSVALDRPEFGVGIPIIRADRARFSRAFSRDFWNRILIDA